MTERNRTEMSTRHTATLICTLSITSLVLAGCGGNDDSSEGEGIEASITLYTSEPQEKIDELIADFNEVEPDVDVEVYRAGTGDLTARIESEMAGGDPGADVFLAADAPTFEGYKEQDLLLPLESEEAEAVQEEFQDPEGYYYGTRVIPTVIAYNTNDVDTPPESWDELTEEEYDGQITLPNPAVSGAAAFNAAVWYLNDDMGESWFEDVAENSPVIADSNGPVGQDVASGTYPVGIVVDFMMRDLRDQGSPVEVSYPVEGAPYIYQPVGIFESTEEEEASRAFVDYLISQRGQEFAVEQNYMPVRDDAGTPEGAPDLDEVTLMEADIDEVSENQEEAIDLFDSTIGAN